LAEVLPPLNLSRPTVGTFTAVLYEQVLTAAEAGNVFTLTVSSGDEERVFFFTRGAILFLASGATGSEVLARSIVGKELLPKSQVDELTVRACMDGPLLQEILAKEHILRPETILNLVEDVVEDHLLEVVLWDRALYEIVPGNPPGRLYERDAPSVRLSTSANAVIARVRPRIQEVTAVSVSLGSFRSTVRRAPGAAPDTSTERRRASVLGHVTDAPRTVKEVLDATRMDGLWALSAAQALVGLVADGQITLDKAPAERVPAEELSKAAEIEHVLDSFVNGLLARMHLAKLYEKGLDPEKAALQYRGIADEHLANDRNSDGLGALRESLRLQPKDLGARELLVKALRTANQVQEAAREAIALGRDLIELGFPGRARNAFNLALEIVPGSIDALWLVAGLLSRLGYPEDSARCYSEIAERAEKAGEPGRALAARQACVAIGEKHPAVKLTLKDLTGFDVKALAAARAARESVGFIASLFGRGLGDESLERLDRIRAVVLSPPALVLASLVVLAATLAWGTYELLARRAYEAAASRALVEIGAGHFEDARAAVHDFQSTWARSRSGPLGDALEADIDEEERFVHERASARDAREAERLEKEGRFDLALEHWRIALPGAEAKKRPSIEEGMGRCEARSRQVREVLVEGRQLVKRGRWKDANELLVTNLIKTPWLRSAGDVKIPYRVETVPTGARVTQDGVLQEGTTPLVLERAPVPGTLTFERAGCDPLTVPVDALPPWPVVVLLPPSPLWRASGVSAANVPLVAGELVIASGSDRSATAVGAVDGSVRWRVPLGVFGETDLAPIRLDALTVLVRASSGTVVALDLATGTERWRRETTPPPLGGLGGQPCAVPGGVLFREGPRDLACLAANGDRRWTINLDEDALSAPATSGDLALVATEHGVEAVKIASGERAWIARLPQRPVTAPVQEPSGSILVAMEPDDLVHLDRDGQLLRVEHETTGSSMSTSLDADDRRVVFGSANGVLVSQDSAGPGFRVELSKKPVRWVRSAARELVVASDGFEILALDSRGRTLWRQPAEDPCPASADDARVYFGTRRGLAAFNR
jgi:outer membrane protein assembly factor BamB/tetratricopeptide (TPR) repeat protein